MPPYDDYVYCGLKRRRRVVALHADARYPVVGQHLSQPRHFELAVADHVRAARVEYAAGRRVHRAGHVTRQDDALAMLLHDRIRNRHRREKCPRIRVQRILVQLVAVGNLDYMWPRYITAMRSLICRTTDRSCAMNKYVSPNWSCRSSSRLITCA